MQEAIKTENINSIAVKVTERTITRKIGNTTFLVSSRFKQGKQMVFEDTHPAIIDLETWDIVRSMRKHKRRASRYCNPVCFLVWPTAPIV